MRIAKPSDYEQVARLCRLAVGPSDYVLWVLKNVIAARGLFLAFHEKELVGMTNFEKCIDGSGWLGMARTIPRWRGKGVAILLQQGIAKHAMRSGIRTLRFWVLSSNESALKAADKGGFRRVCDAFYISARVNRVQGRNTGRPVTSRSGDFITQTLSSEYLAKMKGYFAYAWHFVKADEALFRMLIRRRELYSLDGSQFLLSKPEKWSVTTYSSFALLSGPATPSLRALRRWIRTTRRGIVGSYLPYDPHLIRAAKAADFHMDEWGRHCLVFERIL